MAVRFERIAGSPFIIVNDEALEGRTQPFLSSDIIVNVDHNEVVLGPGLYDACEVLVARGSSFDGDADDVDTLDMLYCTGAGSTLDQRYVRTGLQGGKPYYVAYSTSPGDGFDIRWNTAGLGKWEIRYGDVVIYEAAGVASTPDQVSNWTPVNTGAAPGPTIYRVNGTSVQRVLEEQGSANKVLAKRVTALETVLPTVYYEAVMTQSSSTAPVEVKTSKSAGVEATWGYEDVGVYSLTIPGFFTGDELIQLTGGASSAIAYELVSQDSIWIRDPLAQEITAFCVSIKRI